MKRVNPMRNWWGGGGGGGGGGGYRALDDENGRRLSRIADSFPESLAVNPVYL